MNPKRLPIAEKLFEQWQRARGRRLEPATRPFSRDFEALLQDAGLLSATERNEAIHDVNDLAAKGWLGFRTVRYRDDIESVFIPLEAEARWREAFEFVPQSDEELRMIRSHPWCAELEFVREARLNSSFTELFQLDQFLKNGARERVFAPIKERSLEIFGDEKRLDQLLRGSALFGPERLTLEMFRCFTVAEPLPWIPGRNASAPIIVIENAATWHSYRQWNLERHLFSGVVYGCGNRFVDSVSSLTDVFAALGGPRQVFYFGDLDPRGLSIPHQAAAYARQSGLPAIEPHLWSYRQLFVLGKGRALPSHEKTDEEPEGCQWLGELAGEAHKVLSSGKRLPQEYVGWEFLRDRFI